MSALTCQITSWFQGARWIYHVSRFYIVLHSPQIAERIPKVPPLMFCCVSTNQRLNKRWKKVNSANPLQEILLRPERGEGRLHYGRRVSENDFEKSVKSSEIHIKSISLGLKVKRGHKSSRYTIKVKVLDQPGDAALLWGHVYYQFQINATNKQTNKNTFLEVVLREINVFFCMQLIFS